MSQSIDDIRNACIADVDAMFAETLRFLPMAAKQADATRSPVDMKGVLRAATKEDIRPAHKNGSEWARPMAAQPFTLKLARAVSGNLDIQRGDRVKAVDREGGPLFTVSSVDDGHAGRRVVHLVAA